MYEPKKNRKLLTSTSVGTGPSSYEKRIYRAAFSQRLRNTVLSHRSSQRRRGGRNNWPVLSLLRLSWSSLMWLWVAGVVVPDDVSKDR